MNTCHSEYGKIKSILLKQASKAFISQDKIDKEWEELNYTDRVKYDQAQTEYIDFQRHFESLNTDIHFLPETNTSLDSIYCRDASLTTDFGVILCNMGKGARTSEPQAQKEIFQKADVKILGEIMAPGTLEGGDMCWLDQKTLAVGHTYRSNTSGIKQLKVLLEPQGITVVVVDLPHYKGENDVFHLMSIISPIDQKLAVVYSPLMPIGFRNQLINMGYDFVECPEEEFDSMGCNVLAISPSEVLICEGNPITTERLQNAGCKVHVYQGEQISKKGCGGPTCLTRPILRTI